MLGDAKWYGGDIEESIIEGRCDELIILREDSFEYVETETTAIGDDDVGDLGTIVTLAKTDGENLEQIRFYVKARESEKVYYLIGEKAK